MQRMTSSRKPISVIGGRTKALAADIRLDRDEGGYRGRDNPDAVMD